MTQSASRRVYAAHENVRLEGGDVHRAQFNDNYRWEIRTPNNGFVVLEDDKVTEHPDGAITYDGVIEHRIGGQLRWRGTLINGVFTRTASHEDTE